LCPAGENSRRLLRELAQVANDPAACAQWINQNAHFVWLGAGLRDDAAPETILLYERPSNHNRQGVHVLLADGRVELLSRAEAQQRIAGIEFPDR
ncbi:MAG: hypothetical protein RMJ35_06700, partial [Phycisphaerales bacterium]|nr:hypothetical protein [Phycisphaerales bacterium]